MTEDDEGGKEGREYRATVEYAPYQKVPRGKPRRDRREGTIEKDREFLVNTNTISLCFLNWKTKRKSHFLQTKPKQQHPPQPTLLR